MPRPWLLSLPWSRSELKLILQVDPWVFNSQAILGIPSSGTSLGLLPHLHCPRGFSGSLRRSGAL